MTAIMSLRFRRDALQRQLDRWIARGFRGTSPGDDPTRQETAAKVAEIAILHAQIAQQQGADRKS